MVLGGAKASYLVYRAVYLLGRMRSSRASAVREKTEPERL